MSTKEYSLARDAGPSKIVNKINSLTQKLKPFAETDTGRVLIKYG